MHALAFVDTHASKKALKALRKKVEHADFLICAGDFTIFGTQDRKQLREIAKLHAKVFLVHGNHEDQLSIEEISKEHGSVDYLHGRIVEHEGIVLVGWGGGGFARTDVEFERWADAHAKDLRAAKKAGKKLVLITHAPFYKTKLDALDGAHLGNRSYARFIRKFKVDVAFCGHFHENAGKTDKLGGCTVVNPGPEGTVVRIL